MPYAISMANDFERQLFILHVMPPHHTYLLNKDRAAHDEKEMSALAQLKALTHPGAALKRAANLLVEFAIPPMAFSARHRAFMPAPSSWARIGIRFLT